MDAFARLPFEIMEMLLLVCTGMLGGVISVTRSFIEKSPTNPLISDLIYKPTIGGAVALGIYVLFRASQLFIAGQSQTGGVASTSIFLVAGLGLASGVCASDAIGQIEALAGRLLRRSPDDDKGSKPATDQPIPATPAGGAAIPVDPIPSAQANSDQSPQREISSSRRFVVRGPIVAITKITATIALAMNRKTPVVP